MAHPKKAIDPVPHVLVEALLVQVSGIGSIYIGVNYIGRQVSKPSINIDRLVRAIGFSEPAVNLVKTVMSQVFYVSNGPLREEPIEWRAALAMRFWVDAGECGSIKSELRDKDGVLFASTCAWGIYYVQILGVLNVYFARIDTYKGPCISRSLAWWTELC